MIIKNSFKQLLRRPGKAILFFLLMTASTLLLVFGAGMYIQSLMRLDVLEDAYSTIGTIQQPWEQVRYEEHSNACFSETKTVVDYGRVINPAELDFPGANYQVEPENRPYYISYNPELNNWWPLYERTKTYDVLEFTPLENSDDGSAVQAEVTRIVSEGTDNLHREIWGEYVRNEWAAKVGDVIDICQHQDKWAIPLEKGKSYIGCFGEVAVNYRLEEFEWEGETVEYWACDFEMSPVTAPFTSLVDRLGQPVQGTKLSQWGEDFPRIVESSNEEDVQIWLNMIEELTRRDQVYPVMPITDPEMVACFRNNLVSARGRMITDEEYETGVRVCLIDQTIARKNLLYEGDTLKLSLIASMYGYTPESFGYDITHFAFPEQCSLLDGNGDFLESFWEAEYEIVGIYSTYTLAKELPFSPMIIIPSRSVQASDEDHIIYYGPMNEIHTSFRIPNGTREEFEKALAQAVPESERLNIVYDDMGYAQAVESLDSTRDTAFLLLLVGLLAAVAIIVLLLYFFVIKEKKRTAIERSLGQTRGQCRASILAGLLTLTLLAAGIGSFGAGVLLSRSDQLAEAQDVMGDTGAELALVDSPNGTGYKSDWGLGGIYNFSGKYSPWAMYDIKGHQAELVEITVPLGVYVGAPLVLWGLVGVLALILVNRNLKIEPILLLGTRA